MDLTDPLFTRAVSAIDCGRIAELEELLAKNPDLVRERSRNREEGYFKDPYLLWFVADNPIRVDQLPPNIMEITRLLVDAVKREAPDSFQNQIDYTLVLVASGRIARECGVQIAMMDVLIDAGALSRGSMGAIANGNMEAAQHLVALGDQLTLPVAVCLERTEDINQLMELAGHEEKLTALSAAAFYGKEKMIKRLLECEIDPNGFPGANSGFHLHGTALHHAVSSGSLNSVKLLVGAGARLDVPDKMYNGKPLDWALYLQSDDAYSDAEKRNFALIETFLRSATPIA